MRWFTRKAEEAAEAFHERALKAERERDDYRKARDAAKSDWQREHALLDQAENERNIFRAENEALQEQLDHARALKESHHMRKRQAEQRLEAAELDNEALRDQLQSLTAERDALFNNLREIKIIAANHTEETES